MSAQAVRRRPSRLARAYAEMGRPTWADIIGGVIFIPIAFGITFSLMLGRGFLVHWLGLL